MHSNDTSITIPAEITEAPATTRRPRLRTLVGGVIVVGAATFGIGAVIAQESTASVPAVADHPAIAEMARADGLTGLSPASLSPTAGPGGYGDSGAIADWARANGLTGLSPASLTPDSCPSSTPKNVHRSVTRGPICAHFGSPLAPKPKCAQI